MNWKVKITGDMTLAILDGRRVVARVDMLSQKTMPTDGGERLCRTINDLTTIANSVNGIKQSLPYDELSISPTPWHVKRTNTRFSVYDANGRLICSRNVTNNNKALVFCDFSYIEKTLP